MTTEAHPQLKVAPWLREAARDAAQHALQKCKPFDSLQRLLADVGELRDEIETIIAKHAPDVVLDPDAREILEAVAGWGCVAKRDGNDGQTCAALGIRRATQACQSCGAAAVLRRLGLSPHAPRADDNTKAGPEGQRRSDRAETVPEKPGSLPADASDTSRSATASGPAPSHSPAFDEHDAAPVPGARDDAGDEDGP